jgi:alditol oxidase
MPELDRREEGRSHRRHREVMRNWAGNVTYRATVHHEPTSIDQISAIVRRAELVRPLGSRHSFSGLADTLGEHVSLARLGLPISIDREALTVEVDGGRRYGEVCQALDEAGSALANLASLPHISIAGACATATHGSGVGNGSLASSVLSLELVRADGEVVTIDRSRDPEVFGGAAVSLGAMGIVTRLTLKLEPAYAVRQHVYEGLPFEVFEKHAEEILGAAYSVSLFTDWTTPSFHQTWLKSRVAARASGDDGPDHMFGARRASNEVHPIRGFPAVACTPQLGRPGPWHERLPHFRLDHTPSAGDELQSEYFVGRQDAAAAVRAIAAIGSRIAPLVRVSEIRTVAADELWLSPAYRRDSATLHFTWRPEPEAVLRVLPLIEAALEPLRPRPHWGKLSTLDAMAMRGAYERLPAFVALARRLDPEGKFRNPFLDRLVFSD